VVFFEEFQYGKWYREMVQPMKRIWFHRTRRRSERPLCPPDRGWRRDSWWRQSRIWYWRNRKRPKRN